jgi:hypothetical protein
MTALPITRSRDDPRPPAPVPAARPSRDSCVDAFVDSYVDWREDCVTLEAAYQRWTGSARLERGMAFSAYHAALDREEKAAAVYGSAARQLAARTSESAGP